MDEQAEEIEVLQSIFPTEFEQLETPNKFKIHVSPGGDEVHGKKSFDPSNMCRFDKLVLKIHAELFLISFFFLFKRSCRRTFSRVPSRLPICGAYRDDRGGEGSRKETCR